MSGETSALLETSRLILRRFEVAAPSGRITISGTSGERSLPLPSIVHFSGKIEGDPDSRVYVAAQETVAVEVCRHEWLVIKDKLGGVH